MIDYLPIMNVYTGVFRSRFPEEIISYDTMFIPMDKWVWTFTFVSVLAVGATLAGMDFKKMDSERIYRGNH